MDIRFFRIETFSFGPKLYTVNTDTQHQLGFEYIKDTRDVFEDSNLDNRCVHGPVQTSFSGIRSQAKEDIKAKERCMIN